MIYIALAHLLGFWATSWLFWAHEGKAPFTAADLGFVFFTWPILLWVVLVERARKLLP